MAHLTEEDREKVRRSLRRMGFIPEGLPSRDFGGGIFKEEHCHMVDPDAIITIRWDGDR